jgi:tripartite-type tricarboxylate transporter receptor subunit TctC
VGEAFYRDCVEPIARAVSGSRRTASLPDVPTVAETGVAGFDASFFETLSAPKSTPQAVIDRLQKDVAKALADPKVREALATADLDPVASAPADAARQMRADSEKWRAVDDRVKLQLD